MKDFMMIFIGANYEDLGLSAEELQGRMGKWWAWGGKMEAAGILKGGNALQSTAKRVSGPAPNTKFAVNSGSSVTKATVVILMPSTLISH